MFSKSLKKTLLNQNGGALLLVVSVGAIVGTAAYIATSNSRSLQVEQKKLTDHNERNRIYNSLKSSFASYNFCTQALKMAKGSVVNGGKVIISDALLKEHQIISSTEKLQNYFIKDINLIEQSSFSDSENNINFKNFKVEVEIEHRDGSLAEGVGSFLVKTYNKVSNKYQKNEEAFFITTSDKNHCFGHADAINTYSGLVSNAAKQMCNSLGSSSPNPNFSICNVKEFKDKQVDGKYAGLDLSQTSNTDTNFQEAFCKVELAALQRAGFHQRMATGKSHYEWTTLCRKPRWYGCTRDGYHQPLATWGENTVIQSWDTNNGKNKTQVQKAMQDKAKRLSEYTIERRKERVFTHLAYNNLDTDGVQSTLLPHFMRGGSDVPALLAATAGFGAEAAIAYFGGAFMGPFGIITFKLLLSILGKGCDNTRIRAEYKCVEGVEEVEKIFFDFQKISFKGLRRRCNWRNASTWIVPTELAIKNAVYDQWLDENGVPKKEGALVDALTHSEAITYKNDINMVTSIHSLYNPAPPPGEGFDLTETSVPLPKGLEEVFKRREAELWYALFSNYSSQLTGLIATAQEFKPHNATSTKTCADAKNFLNSAHSQIESIVHDLQQNIKYANSVSVDESSAYYGESLPVDIVDRAINNSPAAPVFIPEIDVRACPDNQSCLNPPAGYTTAFTLPRFSASFSIGAYSSFKHLLSETRSQLASVASHTDYAGCGVSFSPSISINDMAK